MSLKVASFLETSTIDYPGNVSAVIWLSGCPFRCPFCQNNDVALDRLGKDIPIESLASRLRKLIMFIDALTVTGGEPTLQGNGLVSLLETVKNMGLKTHVNTNGFFPENLRLALPFLDMVSIDVKNLLDPDLYAKTIGLSDGKKAIENLKESLDILKNSNMVSVQVRTTIVPGLNDNPEIISSISRKVAWADEYVLRRFRNVTVMDSRFKELMPPTDEQMRDLADAAGGVRWS